MTIEEQLDITHPTSSPDTQSLAFNNRPDLRRTDVTVLRSMIEKTVSGPQDIYFWQTLDKFKRAHTHYLENTRTFISRPNQIPGYRIFIIGSNLNEDGATYGPIIAVTTDGRLVSGLISDMFNFDSQIELSFLPISTIIEMFDKSRKNGRNRVYMNMFGPDPDFDIYAVKKTYLLNRVLKSFVPDIRKKILQQLHDEIYDHFRIIRHALRDAIDRDVLKIMKELDFTSCQQARWLTGGDGVSREIILARQQAVKAYPILARKFVSSFDNLMHDAIDAGTSLSDNIAVFFRTDKHRVKRLQGMTWQQANADPKNPESRIRDILDLPNNTVPKTREQFRQLEVFREFGKSVFRTNLSGAMNRLSEGGNPWRLIARMEQTSGQNVADAIDFLCRKLFVPAVINRIGAIAVHDGIIPDFSSISDSDTTFFEQSLDETCSMFNPGGLLDWSDRYHRNIARYEDCLDTVSSEQAWPGLFDTLDFGNGYMARELTSAQALRIQGKTENHCVGGYLSRVIFGENRSREFRLLFSIEKNDMILSTAEIRCIRKTAVKKNNGIPHMQADIRQNLAYGNKEPSEDAGRIADMIVRKLETVEPDTCQAYLDGLNHALLEYNRESDIDKHVRFCGFDPLDRTMMVRAWEQLSPGLPRSRRKDGLDRFIDQVPVSESFLKKILGYPNPNFHNQVHVDNDGQENFLKMEHDMNLFAAGL